VARLCTDVGVTIAACPGHYAEGNLWRGSGAAKRPREPGGGQGLPAPVEVAYGVVDVAVMGAVPSCCYSLCVVRFSVADAALGRRSDRSAVEAKGTALLDELSMLRLARNRGGEVGMDAGDDHGRPRWRRIGCGGAADGGAGHSRAEKLKRLGWRRIGCGGAADGGAGHT